MDKSYFYNVLTAPQKAAKEQLEATLAWRKENNVDLHPVATSDNKLPLLYPVRGFSSVPDSNFDAEPNVSEAVLRVNRWLGGVCLHKTDNDGCPVYIERLVTCYCRTCIAISQLTSDTGTPCRKGNCKVHHNRGGFQLSYRLQRISSPGNHERLFKKGWQAYQS